MKTALEQPKIAYLKELTDQREVSKEAYGLKAVGLAELDRMRGGGLDCVVPQAFVVPVNGCQVIEMKKALSELTRDFTESTPIIIRSSSEDEEPGKYESIIVTYDPQDKAASFERAYEAYKNVLADKPKAVIFQHLAAAPCVLNNKKDRRVWGLNDRSFVAHSHSELNPENIQIAVAMGLATRVVDQEGTPIIIDVERDSGKIKMVLWLSEHAMRYERGTRDARQKEVDFFDPEKNGVESYYENGDSAHHNVFGGDYDEYLRTLPKSALVSKRDKNNIHEGTNVELNEIVATIRALVERYGRPFELEGAFVGGDHFEAGKLHLFQIRPLEERPQNEMELSEVPPERLIARTKCAIGVMKFTGPLVYKKWHSHHDVDVFDHGETVADIERRLGKGNYVLLTGPGYGSLFFEKIKGAHIRATTHPETMQCHSIGLMRSMAARGEKVLYAGFDLEEDELDKKLTPKKASSRYADNYILVFNNVTIESNGRECQMYF